MALKTMVVWCSGMIRSAHHPHTEHPQGCSVCGWWAKAVPVCASEGQRFFFVVLAPSDFYVEHGWAMAKIESSHVGPESNFFLLRSPNMFCPYMAGMGLWVM